MNPRDHSRTMSRIGRSYPRFERTEPPLTDEPGAKGIGAGQVAGAVIGILAALGLIGWLLLSR
jgi:hypothetical protein